MFRSLASCLSTQPEGFGTRFPLVFLHGSSGIDISFCLADLINSCHGKGKRSILLLLLRHNFEHYKRISAKLGDVLSLAERENRLMVVDLMTDLAVATGTTAAAVDEEVPTSDEGFFVSHDVIFGLSSEERQLRFMRMFLNHMRICLSKLNQNQPVLFLIDDLSVFLDLGLRTKFVLLFYHGCVQLVQGGSFVVGFSGNFVNVEEEKDVYRNLSNAISHQANLLLSLKAFPTGASSDAFCLLEIQRRQCAEGGSLAEDSSKQSFHVKLTDRSVTYVPPGLSVL